MPTVVHPGHVPLPLDERLVFAFLADTDHGVLTSGHGFLADRPVAGDVARIHARIIGALQATLFPVALVKLTGAVSARRHPTQL